MFSHPFIVIITGFLLTSQTHATDCDGEIRKILGQLQTSPRVSSVLEYSKNKTAEILAKREQDLVEKIITSGTDRQDLIYVYGVPKTVKQIHHDGKMIFRHYSRDGIDNIIDSKVLKSGPRPYIDPTPHARWEYQDLTGPMFTTPDVKATDLWMDLSEQADWVEFTLDSEVPVLWCKDGNYLVPLQKNFPDWMRKEYEKFLKTGSANHNLTDDFVKLQSSGGMLPQQGIPIRIKRYRKNGVIHG